MVIMRKWLLILTMICACTGIAEGRIQQTSVAETQSANGEEETSESTDSLRQAEISAGRFEISVMTCAPGDVLYSAFGHTAIRVKDTLIQTDKVYNFGTFDFDTPNFYLKFVRGDLDYTLSVEDFRWFVDSYTFSGRAIIEQLLDLPDSIAEQIVNELQRLYMPENRAYRYKFIRHNCTTAVRDLIIPYVSGENGSLLESTDSSYRELLENYLYRMPWTRIGINLIMGSKTDKTTDLAESMFLPDNLMKGLDRMSYDGRQLVAGSEELNREQYPDFASGFMARFYPALIILAICLLVLLCRGKILDASFLMILGLLGLLICFLMIFCQHIEFKANYNLLWCNPLLIVAAIGILTRRRKISIICFAIMCIFTFTMFVLWIIGTQGFESSYLIISLTSLWILYRRAMRDSIRIKSNYYRPY